MLPPTGPLLPDVQRIAVLRADGLGDLVMALPALAALRAAHPGAAITVLGTPAAAELLGGRPGPWDAVAVVPACPGVREAPGARRDDPAVERFLADQRRRRYDLAVQLHGGGASSNPFVSALGARTTVGARDAGAPALDRWVPYARHQHEVHRLLEVVALAGAVPVALEPALPVTDADRAAAAGVLAGAAGVAGAPGAARASAPLVAVHPGARDPRRRWPPERFAAVGAELARRGARVLVVGDGAEDRSAAARLAAAWPRDAAPPVDLVGRLGLRALVGVLERCALVVADDSGPRHLAAAVGTATAGVFWCGNALTAGPVTRARHRLAVSVSSACPVCGAGPYATGCRHEGALVADVGVEEVLGAAVDLLGAGGRRPAAVVAA